MRHGNLELAAEQTLLIRGATSALGQAALNIAAHAGARVIATTRNRDRMSMLEGLGATRVVLEGPDLSRRVRELHPEGIDAVLELVGNSTILDSLTMVRRNGRVCLAGWLGGLAPIASFNPLLQMPSGVHFSLFGSFMFGRPEFLLSDVPLQTIVDRVAMQIAKIGLKVFERLSLRPVNRVALKITVPLVFILPVDVFRLPCRPL